MAKGNVQVTLTAKDEASAKIKHVADSGATLTSVFKDIALAASAAASAIGAALGKMLKDWSDAGSVIADMSKRTGWGAEALSELSYIAGQTGTDLGSFETGTKKLSKSIVDASDGMLTYIRDFDKLGISIEDLVKMNPEDQFWTVAKAIGDLEDPTLRSAISMNLLGRSGTDLLPMFAEGTGAIEAMRQKAHELGVTFTDDTAKSADDLGDKVAELETAFQGVKFAIVEDLAPVIIAFIDETVMPAIKDLQAFAKENEWIVQVFKDMALGIGFVVTKLGELMEMYQRVDDAVPDWLKKFNPLNVVTGTAGRKAGEEYRDLTGTGLPGLLPGVEEAFGSQATSTMAGNTSVVNVNINGNVMGDEAAIRQLVAQLEPYLAENARRSSFAGVNTSAYYAGSSSK